MYRWYFKICQGRNRKRMPVINCLFYFKMMMLHHGEGCLVLGFLSCEFHVLYWKVTLLLFQVTCPSSCVTGLTSPLIPDCFHLRPITLKCLIVRVSLCPVPEYFINLCTSSLHPQSLPCFMPRAPTSVFSLFPLKKSDFCCIFFSSVEAQFKFCSLVFSLCQSVFCFLVFSSQF